MNDNDNANVNKIENQIRCDICKKRLNSTDNIHTHDKKFDLKNM